MISGGDEDSSEDDEASGAVSQWSLIARAPKVLGVDPVTQLQVHKYSYTPLHSIVELHIIEHNQVLFYLPTRFSSKILTNYFQWSVPIILIGLLALLNELLVYTM